MTLNMWVQPLHHVATHCNTMQHAATYCRFSSSSTAATLPLQHTTTYCNTLQHTATHCNTLQHTERHCNTLHTSSSTAATPTHCNTLQHTATYRNTLRHTAYLPQAQWQPHFHYSTLHHTAATRCNTLQRIITHCNTLQALEHTARHCKTMQDTATHCNTLQHTATHCVSHMSWVTYESCGTWVVSRTSRVTYQSYPTDTQMSHVAYEWVLWLVYSDTSHYHVSLFCNCNSYHRKITYKFECDVCVSFSFSLVMDQTLHPEHSYTQITTKQGLFLPHWPLCGDQNVFSCVFPTSTQLLHRARQVCLHKKELYSFVRIHIDTWVHTYIDICTYGWIQIYSLFVPLSEIQSVFRLDAENWVLKVECVRGLFWGHLRPFSRHIGFFWKNFIIVSYR